MERYSKTTSLRHEPKLTWEKVNAIRGQYRWHSRKTGGAALAKQYGVSANTIHKIIHGRIWRIKPGDGNAPLPKLNRPNWKALLQFEQRITDHLYALQRLVQ